MAPEESEGKKGNYGRQTAFKIKIKDILDGKYVKEEGWTPNYVITPKNKKVSRVNLMGVVVSRNDDEGARFSSVILDDGSGRISVRSFDERSDLKKYEIGEIITVIGRPREYGEERYVGVELSKKVGKDLIALRNAEVSLFEKNGYLFMEDAPSFENKEAKEEVIGEDQEEEVKNGVDELIGLVKSLDKGMGADVEEIVSRSGPGSDQKIQRMLENGEIFEISPGKIKVLE